MVVPAPAELPKRTIRDLPTIEAIFLTNAVEKEKKQSAKYFFLSNRYEAAIAPHESEQLDRETVR